MIKKLQMKFILAAMISLFVVLSIVIGTANIINYKRVISDADMKLGILTQNGDKFPENMGKHFKGASPEMPYESRYFSVRFSEDDSVSTVNTGRIVSVNKEQATAYAKMAIESEKECGFIDTYRYKVYTDDDGTVHVCFLSCHRELDAVKNFLRISVIVALVGFVAVMVLLIVTSRQIIKPVSESYEKQKRFITDAGHELKTPLTIISADTEILEMDHGENEWIDDIKNQTNRLADLTNNLVFLARMEEMPETEKVEFAMSDAVNDAYSDYLAVAKTKGLELASEIEENITMRGDEKNIRRLIGIFMDNAIKYTDENGYIKISLDKWRGQIRLQVYNTTEHIEKDSLAHLFDRFYRTDKSRNSEKGGFGLGLSIASAIIQAHSGKVWATTSDEKSLMITVSFPG